MKNINFKTNIKATNYDLTAEIREYINHQISKFEKVLPPNTEEVILDVEVGKETDHHKQGLVYRAEFNLENKGDLKRSVMIEEDLKAAIDLAADDLVRQIRKNKEKKKDIFRRSAAKVKNMMKFGRKE